MVAAQPIGHILDPSTSLEVTAPSVSKMIVGPRRNLIEE
jgi:hypothetical protein